MGGIPLVALAGRQPQIQSPTDVANAAVNLSRNRTAAQSEQLDVQQKQQALQDQRTIMQTLAANKGDIEASLPQLAGKITPQAYTGLAKWNLDQRKTHAEIDDKELTVKKDRLDRLTALHQQAMQIPDEQYPQQWPMIAAAANQIDPKLNLNPQQPLPKDQLQSHGIGLMVEDQYLKQEQDKRAAAKAEQELQENKTKMTAVELSLAGQALGAAKSQEDWDKGRALLKQRITGNAFAQIPEQYSPQAVEQVKQQGISPEKAAAVPVDRLEMADWLKKNPGKGPADYMKYKATLIPQFNFNLQGGALNDAALDQAAQRYLQTGQLPSGMRSPAMSSKILDRAGQLGAGQNIAANSAQFEANKKSYDNATKTLDTLTAFENVGKKNLENFLSLAKDIPDTGVPWLNVPVRMLSKNLVGSDKMPAIDAARTVALREIARITNDPKLSGVLSDSARQEVEGLIPNNATLPQIRRVANVLLTDVKNVHESVAAQKADIGTRLGIKDVGGAGSQSKEPLTITLPSGKKITVQ